MDIKRICHIFSTLLLLASFIFIQPTFMTLKSGIDSHLVEYSHHNVSHHDNIDDEPHSHTHKHSEDGDEHEHNHEHTKIGQSEIKFVSYSLDIMPKSLTLKFKVGITEKNFVSNAHPSQIYRPPILV